MSKKQGRKGEEEKGRKGDLSPLLPFTLQEVIRE